MGFLQGPISLSVTPISFLSHRWLKLVLNSNFYKSDVICKYYVTCVVFGSFQLLDQDIAGRQSSINAMNEKVKRFTETTDPSTASSLQARMKDLALRFSEASRKHKEKLAQMEELKTKVELFENLSEKLQTFLETKTRALTEADVPEKDVTELSQFMQVCFPWNSQG